MGQIQSKYRIAGLEDGEIDGHVGLGAAVGLHVGVVGPEELLGAIAGQVLDPIHVHAAAVVAPARVALGVLVGEVGAHGLQDGQGGIVLGGDQLQVLALPDNLELEGLGDGGVGLTQCLGDGHRDSFLRGAAAEVDHFLAGDFREFCQGTFATYGLSLRTSCEYQKTEFFIG